MELMTEEQMKSASLEEIQKEWHLHCYIKQTHRRQVEYLKLTIEKLDAKNQEKMDKVKYGYEEWNDIVEDYLAGGLTSEEYRKLKAKWGKYRSDKKIWEDRLEWAEIMYREEIAYTNTLREVMQYKKEHKPRKPREKKVKQVKARRYGYDPRRNVSKNMKPAKKVPKYQRKHKNKEAE